MGGGGDAHELALDIQERGVLEEVERRLRVGDPAVQQLGVGERVHGTQGEGAELVVGAAEEHRLAAGHSSVPRPMGAANSWKAMAFSTA